MDPLLHELVEHPDDVERYLVYADTLQTAGNARGELIALQCRGATTPTAPADAQRRREAELVAALEAELFQGLPHGSMALVWRFGFVREVRISAVAVPNLTKRRTLHDPSFALLRRATFSAGPGSTDVVIPALRALYAAPARATLAALSIGNRHVSPMSEAQLEELVANLPALRTLELAATTLPPLGPLGSQTDLALWPRATSVEDLDRLVSRRWPALERFVLGLRREPQPRDDASYAAITPILAGTAMPRLVHLGLLDGGFDERLLADLPKLAIVPRLRSFGINWERVRPMVEPVLAGAKAALAHVQLVWPRLFDTPLPAADHFRLGRMLRLRLDRPADALPHYEQACALDPTVGEHWYALGLALGGLERHTEEVAAYDRCNTIARNARGWHQRGFALATLGRFDEALASFEHAVEINPEHTDALDAIGGLYRRLGRTSDALDAYRRAMAIDPKHGASRHIFDALLEVDRVDEALAHVEQLRLAEPDDRMLVRKLGRAYLRLGRAPEALALADGLATSDTRGFYDAYLRLAALRDVGRIADARAMCDELERRAATAMYRGVATIQRALLGGEPPAEITGTPPTTPDDRVQLLFLELLAGALRDAPNRGPLDEFLASRPPGFCTDRRWDYTDLADQVARAVPRHAALVTASYARITGRV